MTTEDKHIEVKHQVLGQLSQIKSFFEWTFKRQKNGTIKCKLQHLTPHHMKQRFWTLLYKWHSERLVTKSTA